MDNNSINNTGKNEIGQNPNASSLRPRRTISPNTEQHGSESAGNTNNTELFTDRVVVDDDMEIFDIDAHRRAKQEQQRVNEQQHRLAEKTENRDMMPRNTATPQPVRRSARAMRTVKNHPSEGFKKPIISQQKINPQAKAGNEAPLKAEPIKERNGLPIPDVSAFDTAQVEKEENRITPEIIQEAELKNRKSNAPRARKEKLSNPMSTLVKALVYIACVLLISCLSAYFIIVVANDVFAFVKEDSQIEVTVSDYPTLKEIANELHDRKVIKYPKMFILYNTIKNDEITDFLGGTVTVSPTQNYDELIRSFVSKAKPKKEVSVTIPEGYTVDETINLLVNNGIGTRVGFIDAIQNHEYDYWFVNDMTNLDPNRKYRLEGYLYPDTYYFYQDWEEWRVINKILSNFSSKISVAYKDECEKLGMTVDDVIKLASVIQMETKYTSEYSAVSSVIHNRLNSVYYRRMLECDATIQYFLPERKTRVLTADTKINNPYNSYLYAGLPPGPICNPTLTAIKSALYPDNTNYYFFVAMKNGHLLFAKDIKEHERNKAVAQIGT